LAKVEPKSIQGIEGHAMETRYIGLACSFHDPAIAVVGSGGNLLFAEATERSLQDKRAFMAPPDGFHRIDSILRDYIQGADRLVVAKSWSRRFSIRELAWMIKGHTSSLGVLQWLIPTHIAAVGSAGRNLIFKAREMLGTSGRPLRIQRTSFDHHLCHAAAASFNSPFEEAGCAVLDGAGEATSVAFFRYNKGILHRIPVRQSVNSLGLFYQFICDWSGFNSFKGEEWKVMGLASYGKLDEIILKDLRRLISVRDLQIIYPAARSEYNQIVNKYSERTRSTLPSDYRANLAHTGQYVFSEIAIQLLRNLHKKVPCKNLVLGGGCALNSAFNGSILELTEYEQLFIYPAPADDGNAVGAALLAYQSDTASKSVAGSTPSPYLGSSILEAQVEHLVAVAGLQAKWYGDQVCKAVADMLADGKVVAWVQGRAEFGPRALGNRSILADPRDPGMKDRINEIVKDRESFRPIAPAIMHEFGSYYFENYQYSPYMERAIKFRDDVKSTIPAVVHHDGTGRLQSVTADSNPRFYELIDAFHRITNIPLLVNTSLNVMGKPIVHSLEDALAVFYTTGIDAIAIGGWVIRKPARVLLPDLQVTRSLT
jgi:carbamoyltransferase